MLKALSFLLLFIVSNPLFAKSKEICHISFLPDRYENEKLIEEIELATNQTLDLLQNHIDFFFNDLSAIRHCIESGHKRVILVAHSMRIGKHEIALKFFNERDGEQIRTGVISDMIFMRSRPSSNLKAISIATCNSDLLRNNYPSLLKLSGKFNIKLEFAQADQIKESSYTSFESAAKLLAAALTADKDFR